MFPGVFAATTPDKLAAVMPASGQQLTYAELDDRSIRLANHLHDLGLRRGDCIALVSNNDLRIFGVYWAALRSGLYITPVNHHLTAEETNFILGDCGARVLFASAASAAAVARSGDVASIGHRIAWGGIDGFESYDDVLAAASSTAPTDQPRGHDMLYSSGTTGRPKGIRPPLPDGQVDEIPDVYTGIFASMYGFDASTVYLSPAPLYHAAPLRYCGMTQSVGGTVVVMERFDAQEALALIDGHRATHSQWVPTMFVRMLKLPPEIRERYDVSSMTVAIHAAAPCPVHVKKAMIAWWGPVIEEYYSSTEAVGATFINSEQALAHPGSVGTPLLGVIHVCGDDGADLPVGETGTVYFEREAQTFEYHNDPDKTRAAQHPDHPLWATTGDIGHVDDDGFLYLTDRKAFMIISGGVNIYPQEAENVLIGHPSVFDVAVIGVPNDEFGEEVKACVQLETGVEASDALAAQLIEFTKKSLAAYKAPRTVDFVTELPRTPTGKLVKRELIRLYR